MSPQLDWRVCHAEKLFVRVVPGRCPVIRFGGYVDTRAGSADEGGRRQNQGPQGRERRVEGRWCECRAGACGECHDGDEDDKVGEQELDGAQKAAAAVRRQLCYRSDCC